jgi:hypothetical protein
LQRDFLAIAATSTIQKRDPNKTKNGKQQKEKKLVNEKSHGPNELLIKK